MESKLGRGLSALISQKGTDASHALSGQDRLRLEQIEAEIKLERKRAEDIRKTLTMEIIMGNNPDMNELRTIESRIIELELDRKDLLRGVRLQEKDPAPKQHERATQEMLEKRRSDIDMRMIEAIISDKDQTGSMNYPVSSSPGTSPMLNHPVPPGDPYRTGHKSDPVKANHAEMEQKLPRTFTSELDYVESLKSEIHPRVKLNRLIKESTGVKKDAEPPTSRSNVALAPVRRRIAKKPGKTLNADIPQDPMIDDMLKKARDMSARDDLDGAASLLEIAIQRYGNVEELLYQLGNVLYLKGDLDKASERFRQVIRVNQRSARSINNLGVILRKQKRYEEAIRIINQAIEVEPRYEKAWYNLGCIFMEIDPPLYKEASIFIKRAIEIDPNFEKAKEKLRKLSDLMGRS